jgi:hypothetical protein
VRLFETVLRGFAGFKSLKSRSINLLSSIRNRQVIGSSPIVGSSQLRRTAIPLQPRRKRGPARLLHSACHSYASPVSVPSDYRKLPPGELPHELATTLRNSPRLERVRD